MPPPCPPPLAVLPARRGWPLHGVASTRRWEAAALACSPPHALMALAGLMTARLAQAVAPPDSAVWVAAGPGNNGGDGLVAARHLHQWGRRVQVCWLGDETRLPDDARQALEAAQQAGVAINQALPDAPPAGLLIDALLGLGASRPPEGAVAQAIRLLNQATAPVLAVDLPSGLCADSGRVLGDAAVRAAHTLSLLSLKPGLFTSDGRGHSGRVWHHGLNLDPGGQAPDAWLSALPNWPARQHSQHKGSFGDLLVIGGAPGMAGAAWLAARAGLTAGAGRVLLARLDGQAIAIDPLHPELMPRDVDGLLDPAVLARATVVLGCGGGQAVARLMPAVLAHAGRLVLDADGLNAVAADAALANAVAARAPRGQATVLTPHPLEAARLLGSTAADIQADRLRQAQALADRLAATVVLKGSGSVVASLGALPFINPTGNARLGTAGSGDVLAGWLGGAWSQQAHCDPQRLAADVVWLHGQAAEGGDARLPLRASDLIEAMARGLPAVG